MVAIVLASDHAGLELKEQVKQFLLEHGHQVEDLGAYAGESVDYPDYAVKLANALRDDVAKQGVLICGTGIGISIAANRFAHIRAALCHNVLTAQMAREHNNANVLVLGARVIDASTAFACVETFFSTLYAAGRHERRVEKLGAIIGGDRN